MSKNTQLNLSQLLIYAACLTVSCLISIQAMAADVPRLVLQITVDGLRGDRLDLYSDNFGKDGLNYLRDKGVVYHNAHYLHANTETIVGHTTLATGATPAVHGMIGNVWYNADSGELGYNIEDANAPLIPTRQEIAEGEQVDPAQKRAGSSGRSPREILAPTFGDTLKVATDGEAKIFGISGKDRGAVAMAGKTGTAYWYSTNTGDFESSTYYMDKYPEWVNSWNGERMAEQLSDGQWELFMNPDKYRPGRRDDRPYEVDLKGYSRTFPHPFGPKDHPLFFTRVQVSPEGDRLLLDFGKDLIESEAVGEDEVTDYLSISFSGVDAVNHFFGPASLESEDVLLQLDRTLADLFKFIDQRIGLDNTLIVFSADHGMAEMPEYATELGYEAGRYYGDDVLATAREISSTLFGSDELVKDFFRPYLYLDGAACKAKGFDRQVVAAAIADELAKAKGIGGAIVSNSSNQGDSLGAVAAVRHNYHPQRAGDVYIYQQPYWFMFERGPVAAMHGSPWSYDTHVPIIFAGQSIKPARVGRLVHPIDVAPTLSAILNISPPAAAEGSVLEEVVHP
ncbi:MAG: alkaline phosphatase family protein [Gammaproteobacteria bacterium]|nr:alkaline phosphatase family protein [Gammaproteobacteria bacterium]